MTHSLDLAGESVEFHPWGGLYWPAQSTLLLSDLHLGKVMHFRKYGAAVPREALLRNFDRLSRICTQFQPRTLCFLGDLFHSHVNREWDLFEKWARETGSRLQLIVGNHDIISPLRYEALGFELFQHLETGPFRLTHHPEKSPGRFNIAGHIHPAVRLGGAGRQTLRLPCFHLRANQLILPAFGAFTGTHALDPEPGDQFFALTGDAVVPLAVEQTGPTP
ncbi:ligase-associated DNA damage response endonuclease PdeM [Robiginitalea sp. SC105]|uniref:ligase-associated DNA damage response endonuclease PdeM n=1 Tax=Robiginitalea sp. SC105 TaxID=2762332 RepID=UPI00163B1834|nr:ligase-associated DNA damage response endonuclease PdeM [Robiginitalea sp. SC105]MBC2838515.1 ligase-associated DNA damage response endonuclease PdeM [Robiginitalea sp. SC105]